MGALPECCSNEGQPETPHAMPSKLAAVEGDLVVYGDYFNQDTRAILAICDMSGVQAKLVVIDTFKIEHMRDSFTTMNPSGTIPVIKANNPSKKLITGDKDLCAFYTYLLDTYSEINEALFPPNQTKQIDEMMLWFKKTLRKNSSGLVRSALGSSQNARDSCKIEDTMKKRLDNFYKDVLVECERRLQ